MLLAELLDSFEGVFFDGVLLDGVCISCFLALLLLDLSFFFKADFLTLFFVLFFDFCSLVYLGNVGGKAVDLLGEEDSKRFSETLGTVLTEGDFPFNGFSLEVLGFLTRFKSTFFISG